MASIAKLKLAAIGGLAGGAILTFFAILTPTSFEPNALVNASKETTELDSNNEASWTAVPGPNNVNITWSHTLYALNDADAKSVSFKALILVG
jgi:hypothetical protein